MVRRRDGAANCLFGYLSFSYGLGLAAERAATDGGCRLHVADDHLRGIARLPDKSRVQLELSHLLYDIASEMGGTFSAEHGIGALHVPEMSSYKDGVEVQLMQQFKALLDPNNIMNPGRVLPAN